MKLTIEALSIVVATKPVDFRKEINGLTAMIVSEFEEDPLGRLYVFYNRHRDKIKIIGWHNNGFVLIYKRLERGRFKFEFKNNEDHVTLENKQLHWLLAGLEWQLMSSCHDVNFDEFC